MFYFGCWTETGHYLHDRDGNSLRQAGPFRPQNVDTVYAPWPGENVTRVNLVHTNGWTVLAMWDRSVDTRPGSNVAFIEEGELTLADMWAQAHSQFPQIVQRLQAAPLDATGEQK